LPSALVLVAGGAVLLTLSGGALAYGRSRRRQNRATVEMVEGSFVTVPNSYASVEKVN
jgi:hypothetical protein